MPRIAIGTKVPYLPRRFEKDERVAAGREKKPETLEQACGQVIAKNRENLGLSQMDVAVATGYSLRYIGDVERGTKSATLRTLNDLATLFKTRLGSIITDAEMLLNKRENQNKGKLGKSTKRDSS